MGALQERFEQFEDAGATVLGVSANSPFSQGAFREEHGLKFDLVSDMARKAIDVYDVETDIPDLGFHDIANRAVFVLGEEGTITYQWVADDPTNEPPSGDLLEAVESFNCILI